MSKCCLLLKLSYSADTLYWKGKILSSDNTKTFLTISQNLAHLTILKKNQLKEILKKSSKKIGDFESVFKPTKLEYGHIQTSARRTLC